MMINLLRAILVRFFRNRLTVEGAEQLPAGPFLVAANHIDFLDGFVLTAAFWKTKRHPLHFITKTSNYGWTTLTIRIDPDNPATVLDRALARLQQGQNICIFIEGLRNQTGVLLPGKTGTARLAIAARVPIVPVGLTGIPPQRLFGASLLQMLRGHVRPTVRIGQPVLSEASPPDPRALTDEVMRQIGRLCNKQRTPYRSADE